MEGYIKSGEICKKAREYGATLLKEGVKYLDIAEKVEAKIVELGGKPAFPVDVGIDHVAAHDSPRFDDDRVLKKGDVVKLDLGVHVNGAVTDTAVTVEVGSDEFDKLIKCSEEALNKALEIAKPGVEIGKIGKVIQEVIQGKGFSPIINLSGHRVDLFEVHAKPSIPNYDNGDSTKLEEGQVFAIEPFVTTGEGKVTEGKLSGIYELVFDKNIRDANARKILEFIKEEYGTLPFSERWLIKKFGNVAKLALLLLGREGIIKQFNTLPEISKGQVAQAERTFIVGKGVIN
ncbi:MAG: type II methionyl aminopeptidase [Candidatus Woesearchaeota archaeon]